MRKNCIIIVECQNSEIDRLHLYVESMKCVMRELEIVISFSIYFDSLSGNEMQQIIVAIWIPTE